jgi:hypothetical protein
MMQALGLLFAQQQDVIEEAETAHHRRSIASFTMPAVSVCCLFVSQWLNSTPYLHLGVVGEH